MCLLEEMSRRSVIFQQIRMAEAHITRDDHGS